MKQVKEYKRRKKSKDEELFATLEKTFILTYLRSRGHTWESLKELPEDERKQLLRSASIFASSKLAEIETRAKLVREIHDNFKPFE